jgi:hypothetical protein
VAWQRGTRLKGVLTLTIEQSQASGAQDSPYVRSGARCCHVDKQRTVQPASRHLLSTGVPEMNWLPELLNGLKDIAIVVFLGYGLKLMKQQNELLEREKALKQSEIDVHKANIERLKSLQAPSIARDLEQMTRTADELAKRKQELEKQVESLTAAQSEEARRVADKSYLNGLSDGGMEAIALLQKSLDSAVQSGRSYEDDLLQELSKTTVHLTDITERALNGERPELTAWEEWWAKLMPPEARHQSNARRPKD